MSGYSSFETKVKVRVSLFEFFFSTIEVFLSVKNYDLSKRGQEFAALNGKRLGIDH